MGLRRFMATYVLPPPQVGGMLFGQWMRTLRDNRFSIDPPYWLRAAALTGMSVATSCTAVVERMWYGAAIENTHPQPPIFILGFWRSGTTHLHNLMANDPRLIAPTTYQALCPHIFLTTQKTTPWLLRPLIERRRPMDNMAAGLQLPQEDEFALCAMTGLSLNMGFAFERSANRYEKYLTFEGVRDAELEVWKNALTTFVKKLVVQEPSRNPLLKSPHHTGRIRFLLQAFPDARFVHIHRHPYDVYRSLIHTWRTLSTLLQFQRCDERELEQRIFDRYRRVYRAFKQQRPLIPEDRFCEVRYDGLVAEPLGELQRIYKQLELKGDEHWRAPVMKYLDGIADYQPNRRVRLPASTRVRIDREWSEIFDQLGYEVGGEEGSGD